MPASCSTAPEPLLKRGVHRHVHVCRNRAARSGTNDIGIGARTHEDPGDELSIIPTGALADGCRHLRDITGRQPVRDGTIRLPPRHVEHALAEGRDDDLGRLLGSDTQPETLDLERVVPLGDLLPRERITQEPHEVSHLLVRLLERNTVPTLDDHVRGRADPEDESSGGCVGEGRRTLCHTGRCSGVSRENRRAETKAWLPHRGQRQRSEPVPAIGFGRPHVGEAQVGELDDPFTLCMQWPRQRDGHSRSDRQGHDADCRCTRRRGSPPTSTVPA